MIKIVSESITSYNLVEQIKIFADVTVITRSDYKDKNGNKGCSATIIIPGPVAS